MCRILAKLQANGPNISCQDKWGHLLAIFLKEQILNSLRVTSLLEELFFQKSKHEVKKLVPFVNITFREKNLISF